MAKLSKSYSGQVGTFTVEGFAPIEVSLNAMPQEMVERLAMHGLMQKVGDSVAGAEIVGEVAHATVHAVIDNLLAGSWGRERASGGGSAAALYVEAVARLRKIDIATASKLVEGLSEEQVKALKALAPVKAMVDVIKGERAQAKIGAGGDGLADLGF